MIALKKCDRRLSIAFSIAQVIKSSLLFIAFFQCYKKSYKNFLLHNFNVIKTFHSNKKMLLLNFYNSKKML